jgi:hypothetical protein
MEKPDFAVQHVLEDFAIFLTFLHSKKKIPATTQQGHFKQKDLFQLNQEMHFRDVWATEKSMQPAYPELEFFYEAALAAGILKIRVRDKDTVLLVEEEKWYQFQQLSAHDQYFFLLETAWRYLNWEKITGSALIHFHKVMQDFIYFLGKNPAGATLNIKAKEKGWSAGWFSFDLYNKVVQIFSFLGFCTLEPDNTLTKKPDKYTAPFKSLTVTPLGTLLAPVLASDFPFPTANILTRKRLLEDEIRSVSLFGEQEEWNNLSIAAAELYTTDFFREPFLKELAEKTNLDTPPEPFYTDGKAFQPGNFVLEVALDQKISRVIQFSSQHTLEAVHEAIQEAYNFANDHLYVFNLNSELWSETNYYHPESFMKPTANEIKLGELNLYPGQQFTYLFDFGDQWEFFIEVLEIKENEPEVRVPKLIKKTGRAPRRY